MLELAGSAAGSLVAIYLGYPLLLMAWSAVSGERGRNGGRRGRRAAGDGEEDAVPTVSVIIAAYNEEDVIEAKLENVLRVDYPADRLEVIVVSDASSDATDELVRAHDDPRVSLLRVEGRRGKTVCQNAGVAEAEGEVLVFTDADSDVSEPAFSALVAPLMRKDVGCVSGDLCYFDEDESGEGVYLRYERWVKELESGTGGMVGANGTLYALRKADYVPLPEFAISDFVEPLAVAAVGRGNTVFAPAARGVEPSEPSVWEEGRRRVRIVRRTAYNLARILKGDVKEVSLLRRPDLVFKIAAHKVLRWLSLIFVLLFLVGSLLAASTVANAVGYAALAGTVVSGAFLVADERSDASFAGLLKAPAYFVFSGWCMLAGLTLSVVRGGQSVWDTSGRRRNA